MSNAVITGEDSAWAQTFVTVTPQDDGFLREIQENVVVSGDSDTPLNLDTWNVVLRRSLIDTTKAWIDPNELKQSTHVATECQTYLQGVPKVELPLVYRDEATQTLYMRHDAVGSTTPDNYFDDIITVLNDKCLPQLKTSRSVQTTISTMSATEESEVIRMLRNDDSEMMKEESSLTSMKNLEKTLTFMEAEDIVNFIVSRTEWLTNSKQKKSVNQDKESQTLFTYNWRTKVLMSTFGTQTKLSCKPKDSNSMLLNDYNETKDFCRDRVNECMENGVYPLIEIDNIVKEIMEKCKKQTDFPFTEDIEKIVEINKSIDISDNNEKIYYNNCCCKVQSSSIIVEEFDIIKPRRRLAAREKKTDMEESERRRIKRLNAYDKPMPISYRNACIDQRQEFSSESSSATEFTESSISTETNYDKISSSEKSLTSVDYEALNIFRNAFHRNG